MTVTETPAAPEQPSSPDDTSDHGPSHLGPIGRLGLWTADHSRLVFTVWAIAVIGLGFLAPRAEHALSGAGWEASGSESVEVRNEIADIADGMSGTAIMVVLTAEDSAAAAGLQQRADDVAVILEGDDRIAAVAMPQPGMSISEDGTTVIVQGGAAAEPDDMVRAADDLRPELQDLSGDGIAVEVTGSSAMWAGFNDANKSAMLRSEVISWPVTLTILVLAFGSLVAAGLPLLLTIVGLTSAAGSLFIASQFFDVSIWAMNFAMMFALALGIDYALFLVARYRAALFGSGMEPREAVGVAMDTAGKAVLFSGITVLISLSAVMLVPSPAFRSMSLGIMLAVTFVLAATLTLLPALLARLGTRVNRLSLSWVNTGEHRSARFASFAERLWKRPLVWGIPTVILLVLLALPVMDLRTAMPSIKVVPEDDTARIGYEQVQDSFGDGAPGAIHVIVDTSEFQQAQTAAQGVDGVANITPQLGGSDDRAVFHVVPTVDPSSTSFGDTVDELRDSLPDSAAVGGAAVVNHDLESTLSDSTAPVIAIVLVLGFALLLVALQAPVIAAVGVVTNLLATGAAFGIAKWIFQDGYLTDLFGFESQGFLDAWGPVFFFAMIFAISMDYTVFLLASAREHWERSRDAKEATIGGMAHSGRTILSAAAVMVAVFFTFALSGPLPPREMGIILGVAVLLDAVFIRLILLPVALRLLGASAWWLPSWLDRLLPNVQFAHD